MAIDDAILEPAPNRRMLYVGIGAVVAVFLVAVLVGFAVRSKQIADHNARVAAAQAAFNKYSNAYSRIMRFTRDASRADHKYRRAHDDAINMGEKRHEGAINGTADAEDRYEWVTKENNDVHVMQQAMDAFASASRSVIDAYSALYGRSAVETTDNALNKYVNLIGESLDNWERASGDIKDSIHEEIDGGWGGGTEHVEDYYSQSDLLETQSDAASRELSERFEPLYSRLRRDIRNAKTALTKAQAS